MKKRPYSEPFICSCILNEFQLISVRFACKSYEQSKHLSNNIAELFNNAVSCFSQTVPKLKDTAESP